MATSSLDIRNFTRGPVPRVPFARAAEIILPGWDISLVFAGEQRARSLNQKLRGKDYIPNVLSYEAGEKSGEIIICPSVAKRQAPSYELPVSSYQLFLFIHGCFHLAGMQHGPTMDKKERAVLARLIDISTTHGTTHSNRH